MYRFNPEKYGYEKVEKFPELVDFLPRESFVKVIAIGGSGFDRSVYWFSYCSQNVGLGHDERWEIRGSSYDDGRKYISQSGNHRDYMGLIGSEDFAKLLLINIFGTGKKSPNIGQDRLGQNINDMRLVRN
jgi:hypothetical protein